jgi:putative DNA primase/helicase
MSNYSLEGINITPSEFLSAFFEPAEKVCLRVFSDRPGSSFSGQKLEVTQGRFTSIIDTLQKHNAQNRGIFFTINYGGHEDANITRINAQFVECDDIPLEEQLPKIQAFPLEPSLIVKTRKSLHCYWLIKNGKVADFRHIQRRLIAHFGADSACVNESRVFRLPGFLHCKEEPILVECIKFNPEIRYIQKELASLLPQVPEEFVVITTNAPIKDRGTQKGLSLVGRRCLFIQHCKKNAKTLSEPDWYAMITNLALFEGGETAIHRLSKPYPKYSFPQTQAKIDHFHKSGTKPMTCQKIAEHGFVCPHIKDGSCKCKSPAGLAFISLDTGELRKCLASCKVTNMPIDDVTTARRFINDYLYNIDAGLAETFISSEIKAKFGFKTADLKQLAVFHKDIHQAFFTVQQSKRDRHGDELPSWYEFTERGALRFMPSVLADYCADNERVFYCADSYYFYENGVYTPKNDMAAERRIREYMARDRHKTTAQISDAEHQWRIQIDKSVREINVNPYIINLKNGLYNVLTETLEAHTPHILSTIRLGGALNPEAECPVFMKYLSDVLPESEFPLIQEIMGYCCIPINRAQKSFVLVGKPDSGKSTLLYIIEDVLLGEDNVSSLTWQALDDRFSTFQLFGKLANIFADLPTQNLKDTGTFKAITGEDYIMGERKHKDGFSFKPFARLLFSCNNIPKNYADRSDGFYRRLILIRFENTIPDEKKDGELKEKLMREADGILAWSLVGLKRLMENDYRFSETSRTQAELRNYKSENSSVLSFVDECCVLEPTAETLREELYAAYTEYCNANGQKPVSQTRFNKELDGIDSLSRGVEPVAHRRTWCGIQLL